METTKEYAQSKASKQNKKLNTLQIHKGSIIN